jgi:hypothetical protein
MDIDVARTLRPRGWIPAPVGQTCRAIAMRDTGRSARQPFVTGRRACQGCLRTRTVATGAGDSPQAR